MEKKRTMTPQEKINGLMVFVKVNDKWRKVLLSDDTLYRIFKREVDNKKITLENIDYTKLFTNQ